MTDRLHVGDYVFIKPEGGVWAGLIGRIFYIEAGNIYVTFKQALDLNDIVSRQRVEDRWATFNSQMLVKICRTTT